MLGFFDETVRAEMGGGPASYIPAHASSALALPSGPDLVNRVALRENQQSPIESVENQRAGALSLLPRLIEPIACQMLVSCAMRLHSGVFQIMLKN